MASADGACLGAAVREGRASGSGGSGGWQQNSMGTTSLDLICASIRALRRVVKVASSLHSMLGAVHDLFLAWQIHTTPASAHWRYQLVTR